MTVYHIVLIKLNDGVTQEQVTEMRDACRNLIGKIPGLQRVDTGPPISATRAHGFDTALVAVLDKPETLPVYSDHPEHQKLVVRFRDTICKETLAYDMEFDTD